MLKRLREAEGSQSLVLVQRSIRGATTPAGYVVAIGTKWVLLQHVNDSIFLNGHFAVRLADISGVIPDRSGDFVRRAVELQDEWPPGPPPGDVDLEGTRRLIDSFAALHSLVTVHVERQDPDVAYIGVPFRSARGRLGLIEVTPQATWDADQPGSYRLRRITRLDTGQRYERALWSVAGAPPDKR